MIVQLFLFVPVMPHAPQGDWGQVISHTGKQTGREQAAWLIWEPAGMAGLVLDSDLEQLLSHRVENQAWNVQTGQDGFFSVNDYPNVHVKHVYILVFN